VNNMHKCECLSACLSAHIFRVESSWNGLWLNYASKLYQVKAFQVSGFSYLLLVTRIEWSHNGYMGVTVALFMQPSNHTNQKNMMIIAINFWSSDIQTLQNFSYILLYVFHTVVWFV
jgi:hypothetical protein